MADRSEFHTRQYRYPARPHFAGAAAEPHAAGTIYRFLLGADPAPVPVDPAMVKAQWHDPFAQLVLAAGPPLPMTLRALLAALDAANANPWGLAAQRSFVVADGGQIPWSRGDRGVTAATSGFVDRTCHAPGGRSRTC